MSAWRISKFKRWLFFAAVALGTLIVLFYSVLSFLGRREWGRVQAELMAKGESLNRADFAQRPVADEDNFFASPMWAELHDLVERTDARGIRVLEPRLPKEELKIDAFRRVMQGRKGSAVGVLREGMEPYVSSIKLDALANYYRSNGMVSEKSDSPGRDVLAVLSGADDAYRELVLDAAKSGAFFPYQTEDMLLSTQAYWTYLISVAQYLSIKAAAEAQEGNGEAAARDVLLILRLADALEDMPYMMAQYTRASCLFVAASALREGLVRGCWNDDQLLSLQKEFLDLSPRSGMLLAMRSERAFFVEFFEYALRNKGMISLIEKLLAAQPKVDESWLSNVMAYLYPNGLLLNDVSYGARMMQNSIEVMKGAENSAALAKSLSAEVSRKRKLLFIQTFSLGSLPVFQEMEKKALEVEARMRQAAIACAIELWRNEKGGYPEQLSELEGLPLDPVSKRSFEYHKQSDGGYLLWSIGFNEIDDGGVPGDRQSLTGDWVWAMPKKQGAPVVP